MTRSPDSQPDPIYWLDDEDYEKYQVQPEPDGPWLIDHTKLTELTCELQDVIALTVARLINAGSERDAVNEAEHLHDAIHSELKEWSDHPDVYKPGA